MNPDTPTKSSPKEKPAYRRSRSYADERDSLQTQPDPRTRRRSHSTARLNSVPSPNASPSPAAKKQALRRSISSDRFAAAQVSPLSYERGHPLAPIPGSPYATDASPPPSPSAKRRPSLASSLSRPLEIDTKGKAPATSRLESPKRKSTTVLSDDNLARSRSSKSTKATAHLVSYHHHSPQPQSLNAALEKMALQSSQSSSSNPAHSPVQEKDARQQQQQRLGTPEDRAPRASVSISLGRASGQSFTRPRVSTDPAASNGTKYPSGSATTPSSPARNKENASEQLGTAGAGGKLIGKEISAPVFNVEATLNMTPVKMRNAGKPILVERGGQGQVQAGGGRMSGGSAGRESGVGDRFNEDLGIYFSSKRRTSLHTG